MYGIECLPQSKRRQELSAKAEKLFSTIPCEPVPETTGNYYATIKVARQQKGLVSDENDLWIAAAARSPGAVLISRDSHFQQIDDLTVENWTIASAQKTIISMTEEFCSVKI